MTESEKPSPPSPGRSALSEGIEAFRHGSFEPALEHFETALSWAREHRDRQLWDRAFCNRAGVQLELGNGHESLAELQQIVLRSPDAENAFLAAYNAARAYELDKDYTRALFYARIARDRCLKLERAAWLAWSHNQVANLKLAQSLFDEACDDYDLALKLMSLEPSLERALILDNLGYCRFVQGRYREGFGLLFECMRTLIHFDAKRYQARPHLSLCYGYLEIGRHRHALRHGNRALDLADTFADDSSIKNAHFMLGETYSQLGQDEQARGYYRRLQEKYYPDAQHVPELLLAIDVRTLVNLKA